jgi:hypothetical protein
MDILSERRIAGFGAGYRLGSTQILTLYSRAAKIGTFVTATS